MSRTAVLSERLSEDRARSFVRPSSPLRQQVHAELITRVSLTMRLMAPTWYKMRHWPSAEVE